MAKSTGDIAHVLRRIAEDPTFVAQLRTNPKAALTPYELSHGDLAQIDRVVRAVGTSTAVAGGPGSPLPKGDESPLLLCDESPLFSCDESPLFSCCAASPLLLCDESPLMQCSESPLFVCNEAPLMQCNESPLLLCDESPLFQCDESPLLLCNGEPAVQCNGAPLITCNGMIECNGVIGAGPARHRRVGLGWALAGGLGGALVLAGLVVLLLGIFNGDSTPQPLGLESQANSAAPSAPPPTDSSTTVDEATQSTTPAPSTSTGPSGGGGSPSTASSGGRTSTTVASATTAPRTNPTATTAPAPTTTAKPPGAPSVGKVTTSPAAIWESAAKGSCASTTTSKVNVTVTDPAGVGTVTLYWSVNGDEGSIAMNRAGSSDGYEATLGAFKAGTASTKGGTVSITVKAIDSGGRAGSAATTIFLHSASECGA